MQSLFFWQDVQRMIAMHTANRTDATTMRNNLVEIYRTYIVPGRLSLLTSVFSPLTSLLLFSRKNKHN
jgi:hypothetical protein